MAKLNEKQRLADQKILEGHNVVITGQAGTGKSFLIRNTIDDLKMSEINYAILCTTGIGCLQYPDLGATTVHR